MIYLFGGAETALGEVPKELKLIEQVIKESGATQVLHIPFARPVVHEPEWEGDWYHRYMDLPGVEYLNAENEADVARANKPLVFISGGSASGVLLQKINSSPKLLEILKNAEIIIGESGGAKILGTFVRARNSSGEREVVAGLNFIKDSVIEPHFSAQNRSNVLMETMQTTKVTYGIGIDSMTAMVIAKDVVPKEYTTIGSGTIFVKHRALRIAHIVSTFYSRHGGMGVVVFDEATELAKRGHVVEIFTMRYGGDAKVEEKNGFTIKRLQPLVRMGDGGIVNFFNKFKDFDIVHLHLPWYGSAFLAFLSLWLSSKPYVVTLHMEGQVVGIRKIYKRLGELLVLPTILKRAKKVFLVNKKYFDGAAYLNNVPTANVCELSNPIDTALFSPGEKDTHLFNGFVTEGERVVLFVGNLLPVKRLDLLLEACAKSAGDFKLAVVGGGYAEESYKKMVQDMQLENRVAFIGKIDRAELPKFYRSSDCVVVPSDSESFSLVAAEARACGVPVVMSGVAQTSSDFINGLVYFEGGNAHDLAQKIGYVLQHPTTYSAPGSSSIQSHVSELENFYSKNL